MTAHKSDVLDRPGVLYRDPREPAFIEALGRLLCERGEIETMALQRAERAQQQSGDRFDHVLTSLGLVSDSALTSALAALFDLSVANAESLRAPIPIPAGVDSAFLKSNRILPLADSGEQLLVAVADPFNRQSIAAIEYLIDRSIVRHLAPARDIERALEGLDGHGEPEHDVPSPSSVIEVDTRRTAGDGEEDLQRLRDLAAETPIIRLVQSFIVRALDAKASDIHIEPGESSLKVRFRIDGILHTVEQHPQGMQAAIASRIKILSRLDIAEHRLPQDGRFQTSIAGRSIDLRVSTMPIASGESVVLRILDRQQVALPIDDLGFATGLAEGFCRLLEQPTGIVLVTGPTGSGKTTTLYTALGRLDRDAQKIFTVEDPIEYRLPGINQIQVHPRIGLTFASALRSVLRQDPDVIMVGEIRDLETAQMAIQAALTGHLVLSTVHTNGAAATVTRLLDMGVEDYLLASTLTGVLAQRLVRRLCQHCAVEDEVSPALFDRLRKTAGEAPQTAIGTPRFRRKAGCGACRQTGYSGRIAIGELMRPSAALRDAIIRRDSEQSIEVMAVGGGMRTLALDGLAKAASGLTTLDEVLRVTRAD